jgi:glycosyltransferase involved in cell wall biosynthesis
MKVALIADETWLAEESTMLGRLTVGLVAEQVGIVRVLPHSTEPAADDLATGHQQLSFTNSPWRFVRDRRFKRLGEMLDEMHVDVLHVLDGSLERAAVRMAAEIDLPLLVSVRRREEAEQLTGPLEGSHVIYAAATRGLAELCRRKLGPSAVVEVVGPGVYSGETSIAPPLESPREALSILVVGSSDADLSYAVLMEGIADARMKMPQALFLFTATGGDPHKLWQMGSKFGLLEQMSLAPGGPGSRALMLQADAVIQPQPLGAVRTVVLEAMAAGRPVVAVADPLLDLLISPETAVILDRPTAAQWAAVLLQMQDEPQTFISFGVAAKRHVEKHHRASTQVAATLDLYRKLAGPEAIPFGK